MKTTVDRAQFHDTFRAYGRQNNYSSEGLDALFDYYEDLEEDTGEEITFDCIALCCDWDEDEPKNLARNHGIELEADLDEDETRQVVFDALQDRTVAIELQNGNILYLAY